ncbi:unnamed protein product [Onchocerca flexuosa]|uniref:Uncharacterized protein n=1 Tax=Onchocerca flexuosa TaxID=387005 RepID=A0A183HS49_9BILA|nr:unnamed protein product [Onchocerca flexuosa]
MMEDMAGNFEFGEFTTTAATNLQSGTAAIDQNAEWNFCSNMRRFFCTLLWSDYLDNCKDS